MSPKGKRIFAWTMAALMALMMVVPALSMIVRADDGESDISKSDDALQDKLEDLNSQYQALQSKQNEVQAKINATAGEKNRQIAVRTEIDGQINTTIEQIDTLDMRIALLEERIAEKETEMSAKQADIDANYELYKKRMRAMCAVSEANTLGLVLGADDFSQMLVRTEVVTRVAQHDQEMLAALNVQLDELEAIKREIEADKAGVETDRTEQLTKQEELGAQMATANARVMDFAAQEKAFLANKDEINKEMQQVQARISAIIAEINKTSLQTQYIGGGMQWPSATLYQISSTYGSRPEYGDFHTGVDIFGSGAYGTAVLAANAGTVKVADASAPNYGYGKYIIIDHGGGIQTLYGHMSALSVQPGQVVSTGERIGAVGSTGRSSGPHIHFEIRVNGNAVNPQAWSP